MSVILERSRKLQQNQVRFHVLGGDVWGDSEGDKCSV